MKEYMKDCKENILELLRIRHALAAVGYYAYKVDKQLGVDRIVIEARGRDPGHDEELMLRDAKELGDT